MENKLNVISIDFDGVIQDNNTPLKNNIDKINELFENPYNFIVIYTARSYSQYFYIKTFLEDNKVKFHAIVCEKIRASVYYDDRNYGGLKW